jgi:hypothetical protein
VKLWGNLRHSAALVKRQSAEVFGMSDIETALRRAVQVHGSIRSAAIEMKFSEDAASRVLKGEGVGRKNLQQFREVFGLPDDAPLRQSAPVSGASGGHQDSPVTASADYWRGVLFAAETMSETVTALLRQQREAADRLAGEEARRATLQSVANAQIPGHNTGSPHPGTG